MITQTQLKQMLNACSKHEQKMLFRLAHGAYHDEKRGIVVAPQPYEYHVHNGWALIRHRIESCMHESKLRSQLLYVTCRAFEFHDLGKLDSMFQLVLYECMPPGIRKSPIIHVDAGVAYLMSTGKFLDQMAALLVLCHHKALPNLLDALNHNPKLRSYGNSDGRFDSGQQIKWTDDHLDEYIQEHNNLVSIEQIEYPDNNLDVNIFVFIQKALSFLVCADHDDTAAHCRSPFVTELQEIRLEREPKLDEYAKSLEKGDERSTLRSLYYQDHSTAKLSNVMRSGGPVGIGKTTANMKAALRMCREMDCRGIVWVQPYISLINQTVSCMRKAMELPDDRLIAKGDPDFILPVHHKCPYGGVFRCHSVRLNCEIAVITGVSFFESLFSNHPVGLKKHSELIGKVIVIDEYDAALPWHLWPVTLLMLRELEQNWGCKIIFCSGTPTEFWNIDDIATGWHIPSLCTEDCMAKIAQFESNRVQYLQIPGRITKDELVHRILDAEGSRVVIMNTVQNAAVIARMLEQYIGRENLVHLSTAVLPNDRDVAIAEIENRQHDPNLIVIATSCIECGMDFDFRVCFRERCSHRALLQAGGRTGRHGDHTGIIYDFVMQDGDPYINKNPMFNNSSYILGCMFDEGRVGIEFVTEAVQREMNLRGISVKTQSLIEAFKECRFKDVSDNYHVIGVPTQIVVIDPDIVARLEAGEEVRFMERINASVQIWTSQKNAQHMAPINIPGADEDDEVLMKWTSEYDNFLGYMRGVLNSMDAGLESAGIL